MAGSLSATERVMCGEAPCHELWPRDFVRLGDQAVGPYAARVDGHSSCSPSENRSYFTYSYFVRSSAANAKWGRCDAKKAPD
jgi:hypothetical protein